MNVDGAPGFRLQLRLRRGIRARLFLELLELNLGFRLFAAAARQDFVHLGQLLFRERMGRVDLEHTREFHFCGFVILFIESAPSCFEVLEGRVETCLLVL